MPFTFSHPAIVLPLTYLPKKWFSLTGLIIGSITPDFEYFIRMKVQSDYSHTLSGLFWFNLPLGILLAFIFHGIVRNSLIENLPLFLKSRFSNFTRFNWLNFFKKNILVVILSILIGAASHLFWDSFTHQTGFFVQKLSVLSSAIKISNFSVPIYKIIQHGSTLAGAIIIFYAIYKLPESPEAKKVKPKDQLLYWSMVFSITLLVFGFRFLRSLDISQYGNVIVSGISACMAALIIAPFLMFGIKKYNREK